jgi:hypothetical protein
VGLTDQTSGRGTREGKSGERPDLDRRAEIRSALIKSNSQISDRRPRSNSRGLDMGVVAPLGPAARARRRRGGRSWRGSRGLGKGSGVFRVTRRT